MDEIVVQLFKNTYTHLLVLQILTCLLILSCLENLIFLLLVRLSFQQFQFQNYSALLARRVVFLILSFLERKKNTVHFFNWYIFKIRIKLFIFNLICSFFFIHIITAVTWHPFFFRLRIICFIFSCFQLFLFFLLLFYVISSEKSFFRS